MCRINVANEQAMAVPMGWRFTCRRRRCLLLVLPDFLNNAGAVEAWLMGKLRLFLEWLTVPMLLVALQLPHASLCYWLASGLTTLGQHHLLRLPAVR